MRIAPEGYIDYNIPIQGLQYQQQQPQYPQQQQYYEDEEPQYPQQMMPQPGAVYPSQDTGFLKWLFDFRKEAIIPLRNIWRGK